MSKSVGNVVNPDVVIDAYGADSFAFSKCFSDHWKQSSLGVKKVSKEFIAFRSTPRMFPFEKHNAKESNKETLKLLHETILKVTDAIETSDSMWPYPK